MTDDPWLVGMLVTTGMLFFIFSGVRIVFAAGAAALIGLIYLLGWDAGVGIAGTIPHAKATSYSLSVIPIFILIGYFAYHAGITTGAFNAARAWVGHLPGGLALSTLAATTGFAAVSGASTATAAVFAKTAIPEMLNAGYNPRLAAGVVAVGGTLAALIPPSGALVIYAIIVEQPVGKLLLAGFIPGILSALMFGIYIIVVCKLKPELATPLPRAPMRERIRALPGVFPIFGVVGVLFVGIYTGWATPTEAASLGTFVVFVAAALRGMKWNAFVEALLDTAKLSAMIFALIWSVLIFVRFLGFVGLPAAFATFIAGLDLPPTVVLICILLVYVVLGMFMDAIGMMLLTLPFVFPAVVAMGYDPIWFGIIVVKMVEICLITPPVGLNCFVVNGVCPQIALSDVFRGAVPFLIADVITIALLIAFPDIVLWVPRNM